MTFVCLWSPDWRIGAGSRAEPASAARMLAATLTEHAAALLAAAPRVAADATRSVLWADARGLDAVPLARRLLGVLRGRDVEGRAGVALTSIAAEVAAREKSDMADRLSVVRAGRDREFLAPHPVAVLDPAPPVRAMLVGIGVETCGELAALEREAVEVRLGAEGVRLWLLARADDRRQLFEPTPRVLPHASLDWTDYTLRDAARLLFVVNALAGQVCDALGSRGQGADAATLTFSLASGVVVEHTLRSARPTASREVWMRLARTAFERLVLPDAVTGVSLRADSALALSAPQADAFDRGFATGHVAEETLARLLEEQGTAVVVPDPSAHPLPERRGRWRRADPVRAAAATPVDIASRAVPGSPPRLALQVLHEPRRITVTTAARRDHEIPVRYLDREESRGVLSAAGPDRVSGDRWGVPYAREYFRCVTDRGVMVWLFRDARDGQWYLHGWWD